MMSSRLRLFIVFTLSVFLLFSFYRITESTILFSRHSLQMDFTAYYAAGKSLNHGLNPYENNILKGFEYWDGYAGYRHSRFLYPPLAAVLFRPVAHLSYEHAKTVWNLLNVFLYVLVFVLFALKYKTRLSSIGMLVSAILYFNFFPFFALLDRGQIDCVTLLLLTLTFLFLSDKGKRLRFISGIAASFASLFKLYTVLLVPVMLAKKQYRFVTGYLTGSVIIIFLTVVFYGAAETTEYVTEELPRIAKYASGGTEEMKIPVDMLHTYFQMTPVSVSMMDGKMYFTESLSFNSKASLVKVFENLTAETGIAAPNIIFTAILYVLFLFILFKFLRFAESDDINLREWISLVLMILLVSPFTWIMNLIWTVPAVFLITDSAGKQPDIKNSVPQFLLITAFIIIALPDNLDFTRDSIFGLFFKVRFVAGEMLLLLSLVIYGRKKLLSVNQDLKNTAST